MDTPAQSGATAATVVNGGSLDDSTIALTSMDDSEYAQKRAAFLTRTQTLLSRFSAAGGGSIFVAAEVHKQAKIMDDLFLDTDACLTGAKMDIGAKERRMTELELHKRKGHIGFCPQCKVCMMCKRNMRRRFAVTEPHTDTRPGYAWSLDILTLPVHSKEGNKYVAVMRDFCSGYYLLAFMPTRDEAPEKIEEAINRLRNDPTFRNNFEYDMVSEIYVDIAGEWSERASVWDDMTQRMQIKCIWGDPTNKNSMAYAENAVKQIELGMKYIMAENSLPVEWWEAACVQAAELRNIVSMMKNASKSHSGDAVRPAEQLSNGKFDRRLCNHILKHVTTVGTPCLVTMPKTKGSDVVDLARNRWGILHHMVGDLPVFKDPRTGSEFHSKNYIAVDMPEGFSAYEFLGLPFPKLPKTTLVQ